MKRGQPITIYLDSRTLRRVDRLVAASSTWHSRSRFISDALAAVVNGCYRKLKDYQSPLDPMFVEKKRKAR